MDEEYLIRLNQLGIIPGPQETEEEYLARASFSLQLENKEILKKVTDLSMPDMVPISLVQESSPLVSKCYGIEPQWIPIFFSNKNLYPWHGGCTWIIEEVNHSPYGCIQLRNAFKFSRCYLFFYTRSELLAHELAHLGRITFNEPLFEEMIAYRCSRSRFRRIFGPIFENAQESFYFFLAFLLAIAVFHLSFFFSIPNFLLIFFLSLPFLLFFYGMSRLAFKHFIFYKAHKCLFSIIGDKNKTEAILYRCTDKQLFVFSRLSKEQVLEYIKKNKNVNLHGKVIASYFKE